MCGILGLVSGTGTPSAERFGEALATLEHRGPDDSGTWSDVTADGLRIVLGHRRLSILDLSELGHQPMVSPRSGAVIVYNGEVYNFAEVRQDLEAAGYEFRSQCDTEVVLAAYDHWGPDCLGRLNGMFAIAIYDPKRRTLFLARDRIGIKPVYYCHTAGKFAFGSELTSLTALKEFPVRLRAELIPEFFAYKYYPRDLTPLEGHFKLRPGHYLVYDIGTDRTRIERYWDPFAAYAKPKLPADEEELAARLEALLLDAVTKRLISDVPLGAFLSGGIDSSLVVALMARASPGNVRTFSIGFTVPEMDEAPFAKRVSEHLGTTHEQQYVSPEGLEKALMAAADLYDEPFADSSCIPTDVLCQMTRKHVTVALSGDGGDEMYCGYTRYRRAEQYMRWRRLPAAIRAVGVRLFRAFGNHRHRIWARLLSQPNLADFYSHQVAPRTPGLLNVNPERLVGDESAAEAMRRLPAADWRHVPLVSDLISYLPEDLLTKLDRASMGVALEARVPLLDHRVVEFSARVPMDLKYRDGTTKYLMRKILSKYVPRELWERPKKGFGIPLARWFRRELKPWMYDTLLAKTAWMADMIRRDAVERILADHCAGRANHALLIWALINWRLWQKRMGLAG